MLILERVIKSHALLHFLASSAFLTFPTLSIESIRHHRVIINFVAIYYEKSASRNASLRKKENISEKKFTESE